MDTGLLVQYAVIALAVLISAGYVVRRQFPAALRRLRVALAARLLRANQPAWILRVGRALAPPASSSNAGCGGCNGCDS